MCKVGGTLARWLYKSIPQHCRTQKDDREESPARGYEIIAISTFINFYQDARVIGWEIISEFTTLMREIDSTTARSNEIFTTDRLLRSVEHTRD